MKTLSILIFTVFYLVLLALFMEVVGKINVYKLEIAAWNHSPKPDWMF